MVSDVSQLRPPHSPDQYHQFNWNTTFQLIETSRKVAERTQLIAHNHLSFCLTKNDSHHKYATKLVWEQIKHSWQIARK